MKRPNRLTLLTVAEVSLLAGLLIGQNAAAEHLRPTGEYSEAKLGESGSVGSSTASARNGGQGRSPQSVSSSTQSSESAGLTEQATAWAREKWQGLKEMAGWTEPVKTARSVPRPTSSPGGPVPGGPLPAPSHDPNSATASPQDSAAATSPKSQSLGTAPSVPQAESESTYTPPTPVGAHLSAPIAKSNKRDLTPVKATIDMSTVRKSESGIPVYDISDVASVPRLGLEREERYAPSRWALDSKNQRIMDDRIIHQLRTPDLVTTNGMASLTTIKTGRPTAIPVIKDVVFLPKGKVSRVAFDRIVRKLSPETPLKLQKFNALSDSEVLFLSALLLYQQGDQCPAAVGLLHKLSKSANYQSEANYYLAMCSRKLGLESDFFERAKRIVESQDLHYAKKILKEVGYNVPYELRDSFGLAMFKASSNEKIMSVLDAETKGNIAYILAEFGAATERYKTSLTWAKQVPKTHPKYLQAKFLEALGEYQSGSKKQALKIQEDLIAELEMDKSNQEFQALVALNLARMYFQEKNFKEAHVSFLRVYKDHPMWLQSLTELGWAQLMSGDYEGAIGNMYSIQSPFFAGAYKPESYVIRTIGYLNLCQYGDAYRTLSVLEHDYHPWLDQMETYSKNSKAKGTYYKTVKNMLIALKAVSDKKDPGPKEIDGLPIQVVKEMARHRDFTNLQRALNRQIDERPGYDNIEAATIRQLKLAQAQVNSSRKRADQLRANLAAIGHNAELEKNRKVWASELNKELDALNDHFFAVDMYNEAVAAFPGYRKEVIASADVRISDVQDRIEKILRTRMLEMKTELARALDNNELLRYEVFAGSGENIRYQVAGGEEGKRVPANIIPKSKSLQWDFDGEYWEDEIGHYRSSLKNNCPASHRDTAATEGGK